MLLTEHRTKRQGSYHWSCVSRKARRLSLSCKSYGCFWARRLTRLQSALPIYLQTSITGKAVVKLFGSQVAAVAKLKALVRRSS